MRKHYWLLTLGVILIDQIVKLWADSNMLMGPEGQVVLIPDWLKLYYTTNPGMAFGLSSGLSPGVLFTVRTGFVLVLGLFTYLLALNQARTRVIWSMALILGGAIGNLIDNAFYGVLLGNAPETSSSPWFSGQVIDMIYLDVWKGIVPPAFPLLGEKYMAVLPIFNLADLAIFVGVISILLTTRSYLPRPR